MIYNKTYTLEPTPKINEAWDNMFPSRSFSSPEGSAEYMAHREILEGKGFIQHPEISPNISGIAVFHELHCVVSRLLPIAFAINVSV